MNIVGRRAVAALAAVSLISLAPKIAVAQNDAVDRAVAALGGADALSGLTGFVVPGLRNAQCP
jgi:hypothetical protein